MKKFLVVLAGLAMFSCKKANVIEITAVDIPDDTKVEVLTSDIGSPVPTTVATGVIKDGKLTLDNPFTSFDEGYLTIGEDKKTNVFFIGEPGTITIQVEKDKPTETQIGGTDNNIKLQSLQTETKGLTEKLMHFMQENEVKFGMLAQSSNPEDQVQLKSLEGEFNGYVDQIKEIYTKYQKENVNTEFGLMLFYQQMMSQQDGFDQIKADFAAFSPELRDSKIGKKVSTLLEMAEKMQQAQPTQQQLEQITAQGAE